MTEQKHTPGPWKATRRGIMAINPQTGRYGAVVCQPNWRGLEPDDVWLDIPREANARLIEAAPDLLEALQMVRDADDDRKSDGFPAIPPIARAKIDAAIAKAEGRE